MTSKQVPEGRGRGRASGRTSDPPTNLGDLKIFATNQSDDGPETILVIEGFSGPESIQRFVDMLFERGIFMIDPERVN